MDGRTVVRIYIGILCAVFDYERNVRDAVIYVLAEFVR